MAKSEFHTLRAYSLLSARKFFKVALSSIKWKQLFMDEAIGPIS